MRATSLGSSLNVRPNIQNRFCKTSALRQIEALEGMIGQTPLLAVKANFKGRSYTIYAKAEHYNLTGSIKDRMALGIIREALKNGQLKLNGCIAEATSGNSGIALTAIGRALGLNVKIFMPDWMSKERQALLRSLGAELCLISREDGGFLGAIDQSAKLAETDSLVFLPCQFSSKENNAAHETTTGPEIIKQLASINRIPDAFVAGVGTGGTVMGVRKALYQANPNVRVHPMEPAESPTLSTGYKVGSHRIQGISDDFIPEIVDLNILDDIIPVSDGDGILLAQRLASELGLGVGISSGANFLAALKVAETLPEDATVVTIFCDDNKKYLSTDLGRKLEAEPHHISPDVELLAFSTIRYV